MRITHIEFNPPGDDGAGEFDTLENRGASPAAMANWTLNDNDGRVYTFSPFTLAPGATVRVWTKAGTDTATDLYWGQSQGVWTNTGDCGFLRDPQGTTVSQRCY